jgi:Zn-finger nucleic acid-binding protein
VDVCRGGCGGIWFDNYELKKADEAHEGLGESLLEIERDPAVAVDHEQRRNCPKCDDLVMMRRFVSVKRQVEVDECPGCAGIWLDAGELATIRDQFATEEERRQAADDYFDEIFGPELERRHAERSEKLERVERMARAFRFICPSYYLPGKQRWGAF